MEPKLPIKLEFLAQKLYTLTVITVNNDACIVLKIDDDSKSKLIELGYFNGNEKFIRLTKGKSQVVTIFYDNGSTDSWYWGEKGKQVVDPSKEICGAIIFQCIEKYHYIKCKFWYTSDYE